MVVEIPIRSSFKKMLLISNDSQEFFLKKNSRIHNIISPFIAKRRAIKKTIKFDDYICVDVSRPFQHLKISQLSYAIDYHFSEQLNMIEFIIIHVNRKAGISIEKSIRNFCSEFDMNDSDYMSLRRSYNRYLRKFQSVSFAMKHSKHSETQLSLF